MKNFVFLYAGYDGNFAFDKVFSGSSAFGRCIDWARKIPDRAGIAVFATPKNELNVKAELESVESGEVKIIVKEKWHCRDLLKEMSKEMAHSNSSNAIYASSDRPFLDDSLTAEIIDCHEKYIAEYTFADGYPSGFAPEVLNCGTIEILSAFADEKYPEEGNAEASNESIFNLLKKDINSFEVEAVLAPKDYRMLRLDFSCGTKRNFIACRRLFAKAKKNNVLMNAKSLSDIAEKDAEVQQTLPAFFNIQICHELNAIAIYEPKIFLENPIKENMPFEKFSRLISEIKDFSGDGVVGLSAFGDPLLIENIDAYIKEIISHENLSVLIETDGSAVTPEIAEKISSVSKDRIIWIVSIDSVSSEMHSKIFSGGSFEKSVASISILESFFPGNVYPQFTRMNENENELEAFYRYWHDSDSPSKGKLIIQKYDDCCKTLPARKPADLSPLERNVCWHIKRDMTILANGDVPLCRQFAFTSSLGNVFEEGIEKIWSKTLAAVKKHLCGEYGEKCRDCDEYYTFNF